MKPAKFQAFTIPKKKKKKADEVEDQAVAAPSKGIYSVKPVGTGPERSDILWRFEENAQDKEVWKNLVPEEIRLIDNDYLKWKFNECKRHLRDIGQPDNETIGFREIGSAQEEAFISKNGLRIGSTHIGDIGDPMSGVYLYKSPDLVSSTMHFYENVPFTIMLFKTLRGKPYQTGLGSGEIEPQLGHFCHIPVMTSEEKLCAKRRIDHRMAAVYYYEYNDELMIPFKFPANVLPYAVVKYRLKIDGIDWKKLRNNLLGLLCPKFTSFSMFPIPDGPLDMRLPGFEKLMICFASAFRMTEIPNGLSSSNFIFPPNPFFPVKRISEFDDFVYLQREYYGQLIHQLEVSMVEQDAKRRQRKATYCVIQPDITCIARFRGLVESMRIGGLFLIAVDPSNVYHFIFPSGEISSSLGLPSMEDILHCVSISHREFFLNQFDVSKCSEAENRYLMSSIEIKDKLIDVRYDDQFQNDHDYHCRQYEDLHAGTPVKEPAKGSMERRSPRDGGDDEDDDDFVPLPPVPLPPAKKGILRNPDVKKPARNIRWDTNVVDNCEKRKDEAMIRMQKEEQRALTPEEKKLADEKHNFFRLAMSGTAGEKTNEKRMVEGGEMAKLDAFGVKSKNALDVVDEDTPKAPVVFSVIKSLPLPKISTSSAPSMMLETQLEESESGVKNEDYLEEEEGRLTVIEEMENTEDGENLERKDEEEKKGGNPEENDILSFCMSSSKPVEKEPAVTSTTSVLNFLSMLTPKSQDLLKNRMKLAQNEGEAKRDESPAAKDVDLRAAPNTHVAFHLSKMKSAAPVIVKPVNKSIFGEEEGGEEGKGKEEKDTDYRQANRDRYRSLLKTGDRDERRERREERRVEKVQDVDERVKGVRVISEQEQSKKRLDNHLQGILRAKGKDFDSKVVEQKGAPSSNFANTNGAGLSFFSKLGIAPQTIEAVRRVTGEQKRDSTNKEVYDSPASPEPHMVTRSNFPPPTIICDFESPASPKEMEEIAEPEEVIVPSSFLPKHQPVMVPTEGVKGWETVYTVGAEEMKKKRRNEEEKVEQVTKELKKNNGGGKKPIDHDQARNVMKSVRDADDSWLNAICKKSTKDSLIDEEEEGEIKSDEEKEEAGKIEGKSTTEVVEICDEDVPISKDEGPIKEIPQDRDERVFRKSRFDAPPPEIQQFAAAAQPWTRPPVVQHQAGSRFAFAPGHSRFMGAKMGGQPAFFNTTPFNQPTKAALITGPSQVRPPSLMSVGGSMRVAPGYDAGARSLHGTGNGRTPTNVMAKSHQMVVVADTMMFNRAVMDPSLFQALCERMRSLLMKGMTTKLYVHKQIFDMLVASENEIHQVYRAILLAHQDALVFVMKEHPCDRIGKRSAKDAVHCLQTMKRLNPRCETIYLSNLSPEADLGQQLLSIGVRIMKLENLMQMLARC